MQAALLKFGLPCAFLDRIDLYSFSLFMKFIKCMKIYCNDLQLKQMHILSIIDYTFLIGFC